MLASVHTQPLDPGFLQTGPDEAVNTRHRCFSCDRTYERQDHLVRHLKSHDNARGHRCPDCGKGFNRADLLNRHRSNHAKNAGETFRRRTGRACEACIKAKAKCQDARPCGRCKSKDVPCRETSPQRISQKAKPATSLQSPQALDADAPRLMSDPADGSFQDAALLLGLNGNALDFTEPDMTMLDNRANEFHPQDLSVNDTDFPDFFEQIMMPQAAGNFHGAVLPPDVSNFTQDTNFDLCDFDFSFLASGLTRPPTAQGVHAADDSTVNSGATPQSDAHLRSEAFKRSPWSWNHWIPDQNSHTFAGQEEINVEDSRVDTEHQLTSPSAIRSVHCNMELGHRDRMIHLIAQVSHGRLAVPSFPSLELLEDLVDVCLLQDCNAIDSYIHAATFKCSKTRTELLLAMVAAGARFVALAPVWKMGLVVQEVVRIAIAEVFENDNSTTRELQCHQTSLLWLDIGVWSGFRRKTEIAISFLQPTVTMLSWSNALAGTRFGSIVPDPLDSDDVLQAKWKAWAEQEGLKRVVIHTFLHDSQVAFANLNNPLISPAQLLLPLPASRELWLAPNAHAWRNAYLKARLYTDSKSFALIDVLSEPGLLAEVDETINKPLCLLAAAHAAGHEVWQIRQNIAQKRRRRDRELAQLNRQRDLYEDLNSMLAYCELQQDPNLETTFMIQFHMMSLHVTLDDVQLFAGKSGEGEARKVFPRIREWTQEAQSRTAIWHAGQVFRIARSLEKSRLRDFYAVALYHSALTLWVYGIITNTDRKSGLQTPTPQSMQQREGKTAPNAGQTRVLIDGYDEKAAKAFTLFGQGAPGLQSLQSAFVPLSNSRGVMSTAEAVLKSSFPHGQHGLPPLIENLASLMSELGKLSGRE